MSENRVNENRESSASSQWVELSGEALTLMKEKGLEILESLADKDKEKFSGYVVYPGQILTIGPGNKKVSRAYSDMFLSIFNNPDFVRKHDNAPSIGVFHGGVALDEGQDVNIIHFMHDPSVTSERVVNGTIRSAVDEANNILRDLGATNFIPEPK